MIRIWKGIEQEALTKDREVTTLFVCSDIPVKGDFITDILKTNPDVKAIYFGAGRKEFIIPESKDWDKIFMYCIKTDIKIIIEVNPILLSVFAKSFNHPQITLIVAYYNAPTIKSSIYFKTDDFSITKIFVPNKEVDITSVVDDKYPTDVVIYEEN